MLTLRRLDPTKDKSLHEHAFTWLLNSPTWRQDSEAVFGTMDYDEYMAALSNEQRIDIGVFAGRYFIAKVVLHLTAKGVYEVSFEADRNAPAEGIVRAGLSIREQLFGRYRAQLAYCWVPRWAKGVQAILTAIGFLPDHVTMLRGTSRGRLIEWLRFSIARTSDVEQEQTDHHPNAESGV